MNEAEYVQGWDSIQERAGRIFSHKQRKFMQEEGIIFNRLVGRPPHRRRVVYMYWSQYLQFMSRTKGMFMKISST